MCTLRFGPSWICFQGLKDDSACLPSVLRPGSRDSKIPGLPGPDDPRPLFISSSFLCILRRLQGSGKLTWLCVCVYEKERVRERLVVFSAVSSYWEAEGPC